MMGLIPHGAIKKRDTHIFDRELGGHYVEPSIQSRALAIGTAGEYLVCADALLQGFIAYPVAQGLPYDVIIDCGTHLLRIAVKSTLKPAMRPKREYNRVCYQFSVTRSRRLSSGKTDARKYEESSVDLVAFCALDQRVIGYCHIKECAQSMHFDVPGAAPPKNLREYAPGRPRKTFEAYSLVRAIGVHRGEIAPLPFKWRAV